MKLFCQFRGKASGADSDSFCYPNLSAAAEGHDQDLQYRVFPQDPPQAVFLVISISTWSLQRCSGTDGVLHL